MKERKAETLNELIIAEIFKDEKKKKELIDAIFENVMRELPIVVSRGITNEIENSEIFYEVVMKITPSLQKALITHVSNLISVLQEKLPTTKSKKTLSYEEKS